MPGSASNPYLPPRALAEPLVEAKPRGRIRLVLLTVAAAAFALLRFRSMLELSGRRELNVWTQYLEFTRRMNLTAGLFAASAWVFLLLRARTGLVVFAATAAVYAAWRVPTSLRLDSLGIVTLPVWYLCVRGLWPLLFILPALSGAVWQRLQPPHVGGLRRFVWWIGWTVFAAGAVTVLPLVATAFGR